MNQSVIRPAVLNETETVSMTEKRVGKMKVSELKMVRWAFGVTRKHNIKNEYVRGKAKIAKPGDKLPGTRLRWYGHVKSREEDYVGKRMIEMAISDKTEEGQREDG